jgi:hypothetical protein
MRDPRKRRKTFWALGSVSFLFEKQQKKVAIQKWESTGKFTFSIPLDLNI